MARVYTGTMSYQYKEWLGPFYAPGTPVPGMLSLYAACFDTLELDTTFYAPPRASSVDKWREETPPGFVFAAKVWQRVTHERRFMDAGDDLAVFLRAMEPLGDRLGPLLLQCPPDLTADALPAFAAFIRALPAGFRWAVEFRHRSWLVPEVRDLLMEASVCLVGADLYYMPRFLVRTADFLYVRLLGNRKEIPDIGVVVRDRAEDAARWAAEIEKTLPCVDSAWVFANNNYSGLAPHTLALLRAALNLPSPTFPNALPAEQPSLL